MSTDPVAIVTRTTNLSVESVTATIVPWQAAILQEVTCWTDAAPTRLTVPAGSHTYAIVAVSLRWFGAVSTDKRCRILMNGDVVPGSGQSLLQAGSGSVGSGNNVVSAMLAVEEGDYFEVEAWHNMGDDLILRSDAGLLNFSITLLGGTFGPPPAPAAKRPIAIHIGM
jgi:hypothetical protein